MAAAKKSCCCTDSDDKQDGKMELPEKIREELEQMGGFDALARKIPQVDELEGRSKTFHALSDPLRLTILYLINDQPLCVCVITRFMKIAGSKLSYHLSILKESGLIGGEYHGNWIIYTITDRGNKILKCSERMGI